MLRHLRACLDQVNAQDKLADTRPESTPPLDLERSASVLAILGARGSGKTSVYLSARYATEKAPDFYADEQADADLAQRVCWLQPIDLEPLPDDANLLVAVLVRVREQLAGTRGRAAEPRGGAPRRGHDPCDGRGEDARPERDDLWLDFERFLRSVAISWDGSTGERKERTGAVDADAYAEAHVRVEEARGKLERELRPLLAKVSRRVGERQRSRPVIFALPIDDADLNPLRCHELLQYLRLVSSPFLVPIVLAGPDDLPRVLELHHAGELKKIRGHFTAEDAAWAGELAAKGYRKLVPPEQRVELRAMTARDAWSFRPAPGLRTVGELLRCIPLPGAPGPWPLDDPASAEAAKEARFAYEPAVPMYLEQVAPLRSLADLFDLSRQIRGVNDRLRVVEALRRHAAPKRPEGSEKPKKPGKIQLEWVATKGDGADEADLRREEKLDPKAALACAVDIEELERKHLDDPPVLTSAARRALAAPVRNVLDLWLGLDALRQRWMDLQKNKAIVTRAELNARWGTQVADFLGGAFVDAVREMDRPHEDRKGWLAVYDTAERVIDLERVGSGMAHRGMLNIELGSGPIRVHLRRFSEHFFQLDRERPATALSAVVPSRFVARIPGGWFVVLHDVIALTPSLVDVAVRGGRSPTPNGWDTGLAGISVRDTRYDWPAPNWGPFIDFESLYQAWGEVYGEFARFYRDSEPPKQDAVDYLACRWALAVTGIASPKRRAPRPECLSEWRDFFDAAKRDAWTERIVDACREQLAVPPTAFVAGRTSDWSLWRRELINLFVPEFGVSDRLIKAFATISPEDKVEAKLARARALARFLKGSKDFEAFDVLSERATQPRKYELPSLTASEILAALPLELQSAIKDRAPSWSRDAAASGSASGPKRESTSGSARGPRPRSTGGSRSGPK